MDLQLKGKKALVTGSSAGIGKAIALVLAREGVAVTVHGRDENRTRQTAEEITRDGGRATVAIGDLSSDASARQVVEQVLTSTGPVDILVNNAGVYSYATWENIESSEWEHTLNADLLSAVRLIKAFLPVMKQNGWGRIINIGSGTGHQPFASIPQYGALKAAMNNMTVSLARYLRGSGVLANIITPGLIYSENVEKYFRQYQVDNHYRWGETWEEIEKGVTTDYLPNDTGKLGRDVDVACVVAFLASPLSRFVSGANWRVDGGSSVSIN